MTPGAGGNVRKLYDMLRNMKEHWYSLWHDDETHKASSPQLSTLEKRQPLLKANRLSSTSQRFLEHGHSLVTTDISGGYPPCLSMFPINPDFIADFDMEKVGVN